ncbi:hypothetical protein ATY41_00540 [Leifsonia xyli subsp. xyli]|uniref:Uncharacterized protein n=1 Tax=Leifsonia xyli subsp. xyli TaxID=59736 RepID=A0A1E2SN15_LEIXY|nr:hypothetical protein [Leifsonia xyli]ODA91225.1 hypothetical protein ATY41_00540 [Leifsonia xyli subsp. xyli]
MTAIKATLNEGIAAAVLVFALTVAADTVVIGGVSPSGTGGSAMSTRCSIAGRDGLPFLASLALSRRISLVPERTPVAALEAVLGGGTVG